MERPWVLIALGNHEDRVFSQPWLCPWSRILMMAHRLGGREGKCGSDCRVPVCCPSSGTEPNGTRSSIFPRRKQPPWWRLKVPGSGSKGGMNDSVPMTSGAQPGAGADQKERCNQTAMQWNRAHGCAQELCVCEHFFIIHWGLGENPCERQDRAREIEMEMEKQRRKHPNKQDPLTGLSTGGVSSGRSVAGSPGGGSTSGRLDISQLGFLFWGRIRGRSRWGAHRSPWICPWLHREEGYYNDWSVSLNAYWSTWRGSVSGNNIVWIAVAVWVLKPTLKNSLSRKDLDSWHLGKCGHAGCV